MQRHELEHLIRAAAAVTNEYEIVVIDSQSILSAEANPPAALLQSMEADCYPLKKPALADLMTAPSASCHRSTSVLATTRKASGPRLLCCRLDGSGGWSSCRTKTPI